MQKPWFRAKRYGWGWGLPLTWQGWVVFIAYLVFVFWDFFRIDRTSHSVSDTLRPYIIQLFLASLVLALICYLTGEKPKWRWGKKEK